ncbi:MAG: hypothetical protein ABR912_02140 [Terracidiphilus sp.]|jgi:hypothetical protein
MQTLGLSGESKRSDGMLKSIFWPTVENAWDVDYLGRQGFWICLIVAAFQLAVALLTGNPIVIVAGAASALVFLLGGMGVREASWPAAALVFSIYFAGLLFTLASRQLPGILTIIAAGILLSNVRAAFLASEWRPAAEDEDRPARFNETWGDKLADQLPAKAWPVLQIPFFGLAALLLLLSLAAVVFALLHRYGVYPQAGSAQP